ncbi:4'-phosphopantetheinyl transferase family protein [Thalassotalea fusca]
MNNRTSLSPFENLPSLISLDEVQVLIFDCAAINDQLDGALDVLAANICLTSTECQQLSRRKKNSQKLHFLLSRGLIKHYVSSVLTVPFHTLEVAFNSQLQALQVFSEDKRLPLSLSLSHSNDMVAIALDFNAADAKLGIDIEWLNRGRPVIEMAKLAFMPNEQANIADSEDPYLTFFQYWTQKEALIKATHGSIFSDFKCDVDTEIKHRELTHQTVKLTQYVITVVLPPNSSCRMLPVVPISRERFSA